jgi:hypothetical protein
VSEVHRVKGDRRSAVAIEIGAEVHPAPGEAEDFLLVGRLPEHDEADARHVGLRQASQHRADIGWRADVNASVAGSLGGHEDRLAVDLMPLDRLGAPALLRAPRLPIGPWHVEGGTSPILVLPRPIRRAELPVSPLGPPSSLAH